MRLPVYFISDVHLLTYNSPDEERKIDLLKEFLKEVERHQATLFILGDLFDFWFEYKHAIFACYFDVLMLLKELTSSGCEVHFLGGNHDYWVGNFLREKVGINIHYRPFNIEINNKVFHLAHGDGILRNDFGYLILRAFLRNRFIIKLFQFVHPDMAIAIARRVSSKSRRLYSRDPLLQERDREDLIKYGEKQILKGADFVVVGHIHYPTYEERGGKVIINLGDWMHYFSFAYFDGEKIRLAYWDTNQVRTADLQEI